MSETPPTTPSVVIPAYNAGGFIEECLASLLNQSEECRPLEIIVVDDCSGDDTASRVRALQARHAEGGPSLLLIEQPTNQGPATARNAGVAQANGDIVLFTDSDCVPEHNWVAEMTRPFRDLSVGAVKGAYRTRQSALLARFSQVEFETRYRRLHKARRPDVVFSYSAGFRRKLFEEIGGFDVSFPNADNEDTELSYRFAETGASIIFNPNAIVYHRHPDTLRKYLRKKFSRAYWRAVVYKKYPSKAVSDSYTSQALKLQIAIIYLLGIAVVGAIWSGQAATVALLSILVFFVSTVPFLLEIPSSDWRLKLAAPPLLFCRAAVMAAGLVFVVPRLLFGINTR